MVTFNDLSLSVAGGYEFRFFADGVSDAVLSDFTVQPGAAGAFVIVSGNAQLGLAGALLADSLRVQVTDAFDNPVAGVSVTFAVAGGGGAVSPVSGQTNLQGEVATAWTLGALVGAQSVTASSAGLTDLTFTATASPLTGIRTWTGGVSTDWSIALNWENGLVPTPIDTVVVTAAATFDPVLVDNVVISGLTVEDGASVAIGDFLLSVVGSLVAPTTPSITVGVDGGLALQGTAGSVRGALPMAFFLGGAYTMSGGVSVLGDLMIGGSASLTVDAFVLVVGGDLLTSGTGVLSQTGSVITVDGSTTFTGGSTAGLLTGGRLNVGGDLTQVGGSPSAFSASPGHETWFFGGTEQSVTFTAPAFGAGFSHFGTLNVGQSGTGSLRLLSEVFVDGALLTGGATATIAGAGERIVSRGATIGAGGVIFDDVVWELLDGAPVGTIPLLQFRNMDPLATQFRVSRAGGAFTITNMVFENTPTTGDYLNLTDTAADADVLTVTLTNVSPTFHGGRITLSGGAQLIGWQDMPDFTWAGGVSGDWNTPGN